MLELSIQACCIRDSGLHPYAGNAATASVVIPLLRVLPTFLEGAVSFAVAVAEVAVSLDATRRLRLEESDHSDLVPIMPDN
jgi:hypothetical protein